MAVFSLVALLIAIIVGVFFSVNIGIVALGLSLILGFIGGVPDDDIIAGFPTDLFLNLTGMFFFFSIVQNNGALALLSEKVFRKLSGVKKLYPIMVFLISGIIAFIDPGGLTGYVVIPVIAMSIGYSMGYNPILIGIIAIFGTQSTLMTPFGVFGNIANNVLTDNDYFGYQAMIIINMFIIFVVGAILVFIAYKGWKLNENQSSEDLLEDEKLETNQSFNISQILTLVSLLLMILS